MNKLQSKRAELLVLNVFLEYLKNALMAGSFFPLRKMLRESIDFLATLENIQSLDRSLPSGGLRGVSGTDKNLLACHISEDVPMLFFNIGGSDSLGRYFGVSIAEANKFFERTWKKLFRNCR